MRRVFAVTGVLLVIFITLPLALAQNQVWIEWASSSEPDVDLFLIYRSNDLKPEPDQAEDYIGSSSTLYFIDHNVIIGPDYYYWVSAVDEAGNPSAFSGPLQVSADQLEPGGFLDNQLDSISVQHLDEDQDPNDPYIDRSLDNDNAIMFMWDLNIEGVVLYRVYLFYEGVSAGFQVETENNTYILEDALKETEYQLRVDAVNDEQRLLARGHSGTVTYVDEVGYPGRPTQPKATVE
ncbi:hypothetical protein KKA08_07080 [bacterium]|nr:hypothetical protein [bacterium]